MLSLRTLRFRLQASGLMPGTRLARAACYFLGLDLLLVALQRLFGLLKVSWGQALSGWVGILSFLVIILLGLLAFRWLKAKLLWRLRNRLIVTYIFFGLIPVVLLVVLALGSAYLFAAQFATFIVTAQLNSELSSLQAANSALAYALAARLHHGSTTDGGALEGLRRADKSWADRQVYVWLDGQVILNSSPTGVPSPPPALPRYLKGQFRGVVRDQNRLFMRAAEILSVGGGTLIVLSNESLDQRRLQTLATDLGEISLYTYGLTIRKVTPTPQGVPERSGLSSSQPETGERATIGVRKHDGDYVLDTGREPLVPTYTAGTVPSPTNRLDLQISFPTSIAIVNWDTGDTSNPAVLGVQTRVSKLYDRLFGALGDLAPAIEVSLLIVAVVFGVIEIIALWIGTRLTRTVTGAVGQLYDATTHINRGDFSHRIFVRSHDQLATLANSFNSMTASIENLIEEQKEKQRLENELTIAQEVQAQLFPQHISQLASLEVYGFCRPARTVSGDYYDFLTVDSDKLILAVGDVSGKGISAALLMATIHSAVRAYSLEGIPSLRVPVAVGETASPRLLASGLAGAEVSSGTLLCLLNHQLYQSTPAEKYATLFLGVYDGHQRELIYSNGGHLPPIILAEDGSLRRLERGGTVIGLFDHRSYEEGSVALRQGELFLAYSDGVTEPENDFGEFGEQRLIDLVWKNRDLPLQRICEIVTAAVDDWIGANEQPDDITLVLARGR